MRLAIGLMADISDEAKFSETTNNSKCYILNFLSLIESKLGTQTMMHHVPQGAGREYDPRNF